MSNVEKKLESWLKSELAKDRSDDRPLKRFELRTAAPGSRGHEIERFDMSDGVRIEVEEIPVLAGSILQRAQDDADGSGPGVHRFTLYSIIKGDNKPSSRFVFRLRGESDLDMDDESGEDAPTTKGLLSQLMRHNEALARTNVQSTAAMMNIMVRRLESSDRQNQVLLEERTKMFQTLEAAKSEEHERDMQLMLTSGEESRRDKIFEKVMGLVPLVVNRMVGQKIMPAKTDPLFMIMEPLISSMSGEQLQRIQQTLDPTQTLAFIELLQAFQKAKETHAKEN